VQLLLLEPLPRCIELGLKRQPPELVHDRRAQIVHDRARRRVEQRHQAPRQIAAGLGCCCGGQVIQQTRGDVLMSPRGSHLRAGLAQHLSREMVSGSQWRVSCAPCCVVLCAVCAVRCIVCALAKSNGRALRRSRVGSFPGRRALPPPTTVPPASGLAWVACLARP